MSTYPPFLGCPPRCAVPQKTRAAPKRINPITSSSLQRPKTTRTEKVRHQFAGCKLMHKKLGTSSAFLGNSPRDVPLLRHPAARLCRWFPRAQTARLLGGYTFGYLQSWGPRRAHSPVGGPRTRPRRRDGSSGKLVSQLRLRLRPQSRPRPQPWLRLSLGPAQDRLFRGPRPVTGFPPPRAFDPAGSLFKTDRHTWAGRPAAGFRAGRCGWRRQRRRGSCERAGWLPGA